MVGLADCNNFFVSCERVYRPDLLGRPVIVLSNNDGCAVALSNEAKALGFKRGDPYFKIREQAEAAGAAIISGNHRMYGDLSRRVMLTLRSMVDLVEVYSIDEAFLFPPDDVGNLHEFGCYIARTVRRNTGIPVSVGFAPTKTLAKIAARFAKKYSGYNGACVIDSADKARKAMELTPIGDVWGVGRRNVPRLLRQGVTTALQLADMPEEHVRELFSIVGLRMWRELNGTPCIEQEVVAPQRQTMTSSCSFKTDLYSLEELRQAVVTHASKVARRLRAHGLLAEAVQVFIATNRFHDAARQYCNAFDLRLEDPTADTAQIVKASLTALEKVYRTGLGFKRAGVTITRCTAADAATHSLFSDPGDIARRRRLMDAMDRINSGSSRHDAIRIASMDSGLTPFTNCEHSSSGIILVHC